MAKQNDNARPEVIASRQTLAETPQRALNFLRAIGTNDAIRTVMIGRGYRPKDHAEGWELLKDCSGIDLPFEQPRADTTEVVAAAIAELDAWDEKAFRIIRATLERRYPKEAARVLQGIGPAQGAGAILSVAALLERLDQLGKENAAALATLGARGITADERARMQKLVQRAQSAQPVPKVDVAEIEKRERDVEQALVKLRAWYQEWSEIARASIGRRDHLVSLGLARRRTGAKDDSDTSDSGEAPAPPSTTPSNT